MQVKTTSQRHHLSIGENPAAVAYGSTAAGGMPKKRQEVQVGQKISVSHVSARAKAISSGSGVQLSGNAHMDGLEINGTPVLCTGEPNQIVWLPLGTGKVVINEQIRFRRGSSESIKVNALHVIIPGTIDLVISSDQAEATRSDSSENLRPVV